MRPAKVVCVAFALIACDSSESSSHDASFGDAGTDSVTPDQSHDLDQEPDVLCTSGSLPADVPDGSVELPRPSGPYGIGTELREVVDTSRDELATPEDSTDKRKLAVRLFYPTAPCTAGPLAPLMERAEAESQQLEYSSEEPWENRVVIHARSNIPVAPGDRFPIVIFSHGMGVLRDLYFSYLEELASWGFVVAAISHTYDSPVVVFPDGSIAEETKNWDDVDELDEYIKIWLADALFVAEELARWDANDPDGLLTNRLDLDKLGMFGHSYGGATSAEACFADARFKACANFDGFFFSPERLTGGRTVSQPFMLQLAATAEDEFVSAFWEKLKIGYRLEFADALHKSFCDYGLLVKLLYGFEAEPEGRILADSRAYVLAFFKKHLAGLAEPLLDGPSPDFPHVTFEKKP